MRPASPLRLVDTHLHLDEVEGADEAVAEAEAAGVARLIAMGTDAETSRGAVALAESHASVFAAVGHHPLNQEGPDLALFRRLASSHEVVAIGEVGLDHADDHRGPHAKQEEWFQAMCELALELDLPVCVHTRDSTEAVHGVVRSHPGLRGVMHYFNLEQAWADRFLELGFYISFSGLLTRASRGDLREVAKTIPDDRLLLETDAPWGTPRGRSGPMRPAWIVDTAKVLAELRGLSLQELAEVEWRNAHALFTRLG